MNEPRLSAAESSAILEAGCFFIYDELHMDERANPEDIFLYFYPSSLSIEKKWFLLGGAAAMINFAASFTSQPVEVLSLSSAKLAFKQLAGGLTMALTGGRTVEEQTLVNNLAALYSAFRFYRGSFADVFEQHNTSRKELQKQFKKIGGLLVPIFKRLNSSVLPGFDIVPYTELPKGGTRFFLSASQILNSLEMLHGNLAGCVYFDQTVLCTHLDTCTTMWIMNLLNIRTRDRGDKKELIQWYHVFLLRHLLEDIQRHKQPHVRPGESREPLASDSSESSPSAAATTGEGSDDQWTVPEEDFLFTPSASSEFEISTQRIPSHTRAPSRRSAGHAHRSKSSSQLIVDSKSRSRSLHAEPITLDVATASADSSPFDGVSPNYLPSTSPMVSSLPPSLKRVSGPGVFSNSAPESRTKGKKGFASNLRLPKFMRRDNEAGSYVGLFVISLPHISLVMLTTLPALHDASHTNSIRVMAGRLTQLEQAMKHAYLAPPPRRLVYDISVRNVDALSRRDLGTSVAKPNNHFSYDGQTKRAVGVTLSSHSSADSSFSRVLTRARYAALADPSISQVLVRDHAGAVYYRKTYSREIGYQQVHNLKFHFEFIRNIEKTMRATMEREQGVYVV